MHYTSFIKDITISKDDDAGKLRKKKSNQDQSKLQ
jgi:hypothetical protein